MRALVIDDSRAMRTILGRILAAQGFTVSDAGNGQEALDVLATLQAENDLPALALVDWNMPVMDGLTFIKQVRSRSDLTNITLMMVTTESEHAQIVRALAAGAHEYVIKPFTADAIADKLALLGLVPRTVSA